MPSVYNSFRNTLNKINASRNANIVSSSAKEGGSTNSQMNSVAITNSGFTGSSNTWINDTLIASTGVVGLTIGYVSGSTINPANDIRKEVELAIANPNTSNQTGFHGVNSIREVSIGASGLSRLRNGTIIGPTGAVISIPASITAATGSDENLRTTRSTPEDYNYRIGLTNVDQTLPLRSQ